MNLSYEQYFDKVKGGWVGKCAGGILGAPIEGFKRFNNIAITDQLFETNFANDDLDLQVLWLDMIMKKGSQVREKDFAEHWLNHVGFPWNEYGIATRNLRSGLLPPESGRLNNSYWKHSMGCPIRSEIWGMLCAGRPELAVFYAGMDASLDHHGFSVHAEQYLSACAALAFYADDIAEVLNDALRFIPTDSMMYQMVITVAKWQQQFSAEVVAGKIKSYYGDADFTSAPMNVAFTILTLLNSKNDFSCITEALHMGHDSDCIVATAGALIGIIKGYEAIPELWRKRVGDEVIISEAIEGIYKPKTIDELTTLTCKEGLKFAVEGNPNPALRKYHFTYLLPEMEQGKVVDGENLMQKMVVEYENAAEFVQKLKLMPVDGLITFKSALELQVIQPGERRKLVLPVAFNYPATATEKIAAEMEIRIDGKNEAVEKIAIPFYGSWLLLGPFIEDDESLERCDPVYPDHGMSGLPSARYMNHDRVSTTTEFLSQQRIKDLAADYRILNEQPFFSAIIHCTSFQIPFRKYIGNGERTIYLYSQLQLDSEEKLWVSIGTTALITVFINGARVHQSNEIKRCWPGAITFLQNFNTGANDICIRLDCVTDETRLEFGLKEFKGQHPHQSHWSMHYPFFKFQSH